MRVAGVRARGGPLVWVDVGESDVRLLDWVTVRTNGDEWTGEVMVTPDQLLRPPMPVAVLAAVSRRTETVPVCEAIPGADLPPLGSALNGGIVVGVDAVHRIVTVERDGGTSELPWDDPVRTVSSWHEALNTSNVDRLLALSTGDVEVGGPRGSGQGSSLLRDWFGRAGLTLVPLQFFARGPIVVVEQDASWDRTEAGADPHKVASVFTIRDGHVASVVRYETLDDALGAAGLNGKDRVAL